jgi:hypothetical protein
MPKSATAVDPIVKPDPNLEKRIRRVFTGDYKLSIIQQADACKHGELGALLRYYVERSCMPGSYFNGVERWLSTVCRG